MGGRSWPRSDGEAVLLVRRDRGDLVRVLLGDLGRPAVALADAPMGTELQFLQRRQRLVRSEARRLTDPVAIVGGPEAARSLRDVLEGDRRAAGERTEPDQGPAGLAVLGVDVDAGDPAQRLAGEAVDLHPVPAERVLEARKGSVWLLRFSHRHARAGPWRRWRDRSPA